MRIAIFDSGIGGISVLDEALRHLPSENFIYFADSLHVPYGTKTKEQVVGHVVDAVESLLPYGIKALVVACNTATSIAIEELRRRYDFIVIGMEPAVKPALETSNQAGQRVLVLATPLTLKEEKFRRLVTGLDRRHSVDALPLPELVQYCESFQFDEDVIVPYFESKFAPYDWSRYGVIVLGCTHYSFYSNVLRKMVPGHIDIIDGNAGTVRHLKHQLEKHDRLGKSGDSDILFLSSKPGAEEKERLQNALRLFSLQIGTEQK